MSVVGMSSGGVGQADDGVGLDADEAAGLSDAVALGQVVEDGDGRLLGESAAVQRGALAFGEASAAGVAVELAILLGFAVTAADREIAGVASAVKRTVGILAAEAFEVVHRAGRPGRPGQDEIRRWERMTTLILRRIPHNGSTRLRHHRASVFDVTPLAMDRDPCPRHNPGATPLADFPLN